MTTFVLLLWIAGAPQPVTEHAGHDACQAAAMVAADAALRQGKRVRYACEPKPGERRSP